MSEDQQRPGQRHLADAAAQHRQRSDLDALRAEVQPLLPDFELGECIGRGGMGAVFRAQQRNLGRAVAVKVLLPPPGEVAGWAERFRREAQALARLQHPGIVTVHDYGQQGELAWLVMELVEGTNLRTLLDEGHLNPAEALALVPPVCEALQYAHDRGIVHRDIKPENVLLNLEGRVKLVDFGLAKLNAGDNQHLTRSDQTMGTPRYMAPEQLERPLEVDHRADIFSLGVVLYEMLTGQVPAGVVEPPSRKVGSDVRLDEVVLRALQREPAQRYQSAAELETGVRRIEERPGHGRPPAPSTLPPDALTQNGWTLADLLALLVVPLTLFTFAVIGQSYQGPRSAPSTAELWSILIRWIFAGGVWLAMPLLSTVHWLLGRRRIVALSMPMARVGIAALGVGLMLLVYHSTHDPSGMLDGPANDTWTITTSMRLVLLPVMTTAALIGAESRRGAHRALLEASAARALTGVTAALAAAPVLIGVAATMSDRVPHGSLASIYSESLPLTAQIPLLVAAVVALSLWRSGHERASALAITTGSAVTMIVHTLGQITYGDWSAAAHVCLHAATLTGLVSVAGTAAPVRRDAPSR